MREYRVAFLLIAAFVLREAWLLWPDPERILSPDPFLFYDIDISVGSYIYFFCYYGSNLMVTAAMALLVTRLHVFFHTLFVLQFLELIDYYLTYNTAWFNAFGINVGITLVKILILTLILLWTHWKPFIHKLRV